MQDTEENPTHRHYRRWYDPIPELRGLPFQVQRRLYSEARDALRKSQSGFWRQLGGCAWNLVSGVAVVGLVFAMTWSFAGSRFNPGIPFVCLIGPLGFVLMAIVHANGAMRRDRWMGQYLRRRLLWICSECGYDLTGNTSGVCPECGRRRDWGAPPSQNDDDDDDE